MPSNPFGLSRRHLLLNAAALGASGSVWAQPKPVSRPIVLAQIVDTSIEQQDVAKDFLIGARAAWMDINKRGGVRGRTVQHLTLEVDGTPAATRAALQAIASNPDCMALFGTVGDGVAMQAVGQLRTEGIALAHVAPWLQTGSMEPDEQTFSIFADREEQITHALRSLGSLGVREIDAVFASDREHQLYQGVVARVTSAMRLKAITARPGADLDLIQLGKRLADQPARVVIFIGGTPELALFSQGLERQGRQRFIIAMADINLQTVQQMGGGRANTVIATQTVPVVSSALPVVRQYRDVMGRFFDEPAVALSLAGFIGATYAHQVLSGIEGNITRASVLAAFQRRTDMDVGGFRVSFTDRRRVSSFVTQSMLTADGRVVG